VGHSSAISSSAEAYRADGAGRCYPLPGTKTIFGGSAAQAGQPAGPAEIVRLRAGRPEPQNQACSRGAPRLRRGATSVRGGWGAPGAPKYYSPGMTFAPISSMERMVVG
jgi:hypothetical protein